MSCERAAASSNVIDRRVAMIEGIPLTLSNPIAVNYLIINNVP